MKKRTITTSLAFRREKRIEEYYDYDYLRHLKKFAERKEFGKHKIIELNGREKQKFDNHIALLIRSDDFSQYGWEIIVSEDKKHIIKRKMCKLIYEDRDFYNKLWSWIESIMCGRYEINKFVKTENREKFDNHIKHWIFCDEFRVFNFYLEFSNDFTAIIKTTYPYNRMDYLEKLEAT